MKKLNLLLCMLLFSVAINAQVFPIDTIKGGPGSNRVNLVYLGDGYLSSELGSYVSDVSQINSLLFNTSPFKEYSNYFNIFSLRVPSMESGVKHANIASDCPPNNAVPILNPANYFGSRLDAFGIHRLLVADSLAKAQQVLAFNTPAYHQALLIANSPYYGGSGGWLATTSKDLSAAQIAIHELGHSFAGLADEYWAGAQYASEKPNMTKEANSSLIKWKNWIGVNNVGVFSYAVDPSWYRPVTGSKCKMEVLNAPFCMVCRETITERIHQIAKPLESFSPSSPIVPGATGQLFKLNIVKPEPNTVKVTWTLNGNIVARNVDSLYLSPSIIGTGTHALSAIVIDTTSFTRSETHFSAHNYTVQWNIDNVTSVISPELIAAKLKVYPNPFMDELYVNYELTKRADVRIEVLNLSGQILKRVDHKKQNAGKYQLPLNLSQALMSSGIYLVRFYINNNSVTEEKIKIGK